MKKDDLFVALVTGSLIMGGIAYACSGGGSGGDTGGGGDGSSGSGSGSSGASAGSSDGDGWREVQSYEAYVPKEVMLLDQFADPS